MDISNHQYNVIKERIEPFHGSMEAGTPGDEVLFTPDGSLMFVASQESELVAFETEGWTERWRLKLGRNDLLLHLRPEDGLLCATAAWDQGRHLIDVASGEIVAHSDGPRNWKYRSPGGGWVAAVEGFEGETLVGPSINADLNLGEEDEVYHARDGRRIALIREGSVQIYDLVAGAFGLRLESEGARAAAFSPKGTQLCVLTETHLEVWSLEDGALQAQHPHTHEGAHAVGYARGDAHLVVQGSYEDGIDLWIYACSDGIPNLERPLYEAALECEMMLIEEIPGSPWVWLVGWEEAMVLSVETGEIRWRRRMSHRPVQLCVLGPEKGLLFMSDAEHEVSLLTGEMSELGSESVQNAQNAGMRSFSVSVHSDQWDDWIHAFDAQNIDLGWDVSCLAFAPDERHVLFGGRSKELALWDLAQEKVVHTYAIDGDYASNLWYSPDGEYFSVSTGYRIEVRRVSDGGVAWYMATSEYYRGAPVLSPCGQWLVHSFTHTYNGFGGGFMVRQR